MNCSYESADRDWEGYVELIIFVLRFAMVGDRRRHRRWPQALRLVLERGVDIIRKENVEEKNENLSCLKLREPLDPVLWPK